MPGGVIFDAEDQPDILTPLSHNGGPGNEHSKNCGPFLGEQESPLQRPRPPERLPRKRPSLQNRWSQRLSSAVILNRSNNFTQRFYYHTQWLLFFFFFFISLRIFVSQKICLYVLSWRMGNAHWPKFTMNCSEFQSSVLNDSSNTYTDLVFS